MGLVTDLRTLERDSIRRFVQSAADEGYLSGRVLDYGAGKMPYADIVLDAGGEYWPHDDPDYPANVSGEQLGVGWSEGIPYDTVLCTQVIQYVPDPGYWLFEMRHLRGSKTLIRRGGHLVLTYPTNWPEVEPDDLHRFTKAGMERLLTEAGFEIVLHEPRATFRAWVNEWITDEFVSGHGVICRA